MKYEIAVERQSNVAGKKSHGVIYPMFSKLQVEKIADDGENLKIEKVLLKITIEDGTFEVCSKRRGYTGQHTTLDTIINNDGYITTIDPYIYGSIYTRNAYGGKKAWFRLNCLTKKTEYSRMINGCKKWYAFQPANYLD